MSIHGMLKSARIRVVTALMLMLVSILPVQALAAEHEWRFINLYSRGTAFGDVYQSLADDIEAMSGGRISVKMMYAGEGVAATGIFEAVRSGLITMGAHFQPMNAGQMPPGIVEVGLPGTTDEVADLNLLFHEQGWGEVLNEAYASRGLVWLTPYIQPPVYLLTKKPIRTIDDFQGLKLRTPGAYGRFMRKLGASPVSMAWSETYTGLATGVIDGTIGSNLIDHRDGKHVEVAKYLYPLPLAGAQVLPIVVNRKAWNRLPPDLQAIVKAATVVHAQNQLTKSRLWEQQALAEMQAAGLQWSPEPSPADRQRWNQAAVALWQEYGEDNEYSGRLIDILLEHSK